MQVVGDRLHHRRHPGCPARRALNSSSDVVFTATAEYRQLIKEGKEVHLGKDSFASTSFPNKLRAPRISNHIAEGSAAGSLLVCPCLYPTAEVVPTCRNERTSRSGSTAFDGPGQEGSQRGRLAFALSCSARGAAVSTRWRVVEKARCHKEAESAKGKAHGVGLGGRLHVHELVDLRGVGPQALASSEKALSLMSVEAVSAAGPT